MTNLAAATASHPCGHLDPLSSFPYGRIQQKSPGGTRRGSSESGFFSSLNDDYSSPRATEPCSESASKMLVTPLAAAQASTKQSPASVSPTPVRDMDEHEPENNDTAMRPPERMSLPLNRRTTDALDAAGVTTVSAPTTTAAAAAAHHRAIDMERINRWTLDTEISGLLHRHPFANQLLYCQNRTSSIYTDSSDDISSLAGSDSLLWDDRTAAGGSVTGSYTPFPSARSAQIAQIVEYFERKGQTFRPGTFAAVPESFRSSPVSSVSTSGSSASFGGHHHPYHHQQHAAAVQQQQQHHQHLYAQQLKQHGALRQHSSSPFADFDGAGSEFSYPHTQLATASRRPSSGCCGCGSNGSSGRMRTGLCADRAAAVAAADYEAFCLELDRRPQQQRLMVCEGAVRSKLQLFDRMTTSAAAAAAATAATMTMTAVSLSSSSCAASTSTSTTTVPITAKVGAGVTATMMHPM